jgi:metallo-beta-lactamase family protein
MRASGELSANLRTLKLCQKAVESLALAKKPGRGAGMCTGGRIQHHLQNHLPDPTTLLMLVGYQSRGCLGRQPGCRNAGKSPNDRDLRSS